MTKSSAAPLFRSSTRLLVLYDGSCRLCLRTVRFLSRRRGAEKLQFVPLQTPGVLRKLQIDESKALRSIPVVKPNGEVYFGAAGIAQILLQLPRWVWLARLMEKPLFMRSSEAVYQFVSARRKFV